VFSKSTFLFHNCESVLIFSLLSIVVEDLKGSVLQQSIAVKIRNHILEFVLVSKRWW
jgi:hypothetical protein